MRRFLSPAATPPPPPFHFAAFLSIIFYYARAPIDAADEARGAAKERAAEQDARPVRSALRAPRLPRLDHYFALRPPPLFLIAARCRRHAALRAHCAVSDAAAIFRSFSPPPDAKDAATSSSVDLLFLHHHAIAFDMISVIISLRFVRRY